MTNHRRATFDAPACPPIRPARDGTMKARLVALLSRQEGASLEECRAACDGDETKTYNSLYSLNRINGYGLHGDEDRRLHLIGDTIVHRAVPIPPPAKDVPFHILTDAATEKVSITVSVNRQRMDRIKFLAEHTGADDPEEVLVRALDLYDRAICAVMEGSEVLVRERCGRMDRLPADVVARPAGPPDEDP